MLTTRRGALLGGAVLGLAGCGLTIPTDPDGTLDRAIARGELRVGASPSPDRVEVRPDGTPTGREPRLVTAYAAHLGAQVAWTVAGEEELVGLLDVGRLDLAVGGFTEDNAWADEVGLTRPSADGHVVMVRMGENALQSDLERWLDAHGGLS